MTAIKICGITTAEDAESALALGVEALGVNLWSGSKRRCSVAVARDVVRLAEDRARVIAVVVDATLEDIARVRAELGIAWVQLHGDEPDDVVRAAMPHAIKAVRARGDAGYAEALRAPGIEILLDASVPGEKGGTGVRADWALATRVARERPLWLAGGLDPMNVADAIARVRPMGVDVASGVERAPGEKDRARLEAFVRAVRAA